MHYLSHHFLLTTRAKVPKSLITAGLLILTLFSAPLLAKAKTPYPTISVEDIVSIYDGDTFRVNIKGYPAVIGKNIPIRVSGVDTPEIRGKCPYEKQLARKAKQFTVSALRKAKNITLHNIERGKYFRLVADVYLDGQSLGQQLVKNKLAYIYDAGTKRSWCKK